MNCRIGYLLLALATAACGDMQPTSGFDLFEAGDPKKTPLGDADIQDGQVVDGEQQAEEFGAGHSDDLPHFSQDDAAEDAAVHR